MCGGALFAIFYVAIECFSMNKVDYYNTGLSVSRAVCNDDDDELLLLLLVQVLAARLSASG